MVFTTTLFLRNFYFYSLGTLSQVEFLAFTGLLLNWYILNYTISIILILLGQYLIKRFNLEIRYPKIDKLIKKKTTKLLFESLFCYDIYRNTITSINIFI